MDFQAPMTCLASRALEKRHDSRSRYRLIRSIGSCLMRRFAGRSLYIYLTFRTYITSLPCTPDRYFLFFLWAASWIDTVKPFRFCHTSSFPVVSMSFRISNCCRYALLLGFLVTKIQSQTCVSFGVDFQDGQSYFQNSLSNDPFTFVSEFQGCQADVANNILVDPNGDEILCSNTNLTPDLTPELSTWWGFSYFGQNERS